MGQIGKREDEVFVPEPEPIRIPDPAPEKVEPVKEPVPA